MVVAIDTSRSIGTDRVHVLGMDHSVECRTRWQWLVLQLVHVLELVRLVHERWSSRYGSVIERERWLLLRLLSWEPGGGDWEPARGGRVIVITKGWDLARNGMAKWRPERLVLLEWPILVLIEPWVIIVVVRHQEVDANEELHCSGKDGVGEDDEELTRTSFLFVPYPLLFLLLSDTPFLVAAQRGAGAHRP